MKYKGKKIIKRNDGRWFARFHANGHYISIYGQTQTACYENLKKALSGKKKYAQKPQQKKILFYDWLNLWLETYKKNKVAESTYKNFEYNIENHIKKIKNIELGSITSLQAQQCLNQIEKGNTAQKCFNILNGCFRQAYKNKIILDNIMDAVDKPKHITKLGKALSVEQRQQFLNVIESDDYSSIFQFYLYSGCRREEGLDLEWEDIDFKNKLIKVHGTKTKTSDRVIPLFEKLEEIFEKLEKKQEKVFDISVKTLQRHFEIIRKKLPFNFRIHDLRHTFATICLEKNISMKTVQLWLGHSKIETTANIYTHASAEFIREEASKFDT